jgi:hypothetical protein
MGLRASLDAVRNRKIIAAGNIITITQSSSLQPSLSGVNITSYSYNHTVLSKQKFQQIQTSVYVYNAYANETHSRMVMRVGIATDRKKSTQTF